MTIPYQVVVSSENSLYMAWQTQLFCFSALTILEKRPIVVVHDSGEPLRPEFRLLQDHGFRVERARSYALTPSGVHYPARNELGTLLEISTMPDLGAEHVLFCEPDMLFVRPLQFSGNLAAEFYVYLRYEESRVAKTAKHFGLGQNIRLLNDTRRIGVPYLLPVEHVRRLAVRWIEVLDAFEELQWIDIMYAFGIAVTIEDLGVEITHFMTTNYRATKPLRGLIHYCFGDQVWDKRQFRVSSPFDLPIEALDVGLPGTVLGEIMSQIRGAKGFFEGCLDTPEDSN